MQRIIKGENNMVKDKMKINEIYNYFHDKSVITYRDLFNFYLIDEPNLNENTFKWRIYQLKKDNVIQSIKRGKYGLNKKYFYDNYLLATTNINDSKNTNNYIVITADVVDSKKYEVSKKELSQIVSKISIEEYPDLITPFKESRGDEVQALGVISENLPKIIRDLRYYFYPYKIRIGIGIGEIEDIIVDNDNSWNLNGEAFFYAREALDQIKGYKNYSLLFKSNRPLFNRMINILFKLIDTIQDDWSDKQWEAVQLYEKFGSYEEGANKLNISRSSFYERCNSAKWDRIKEAEKEIGFFINEEFNLSKSDKTTTLYPPKVN